MQIDSAHFPGLPNPFARLVVRAKDGVILGEASVFEAAEVGHGS